MKLPADFSKVLFVLTRGPANESEESGRGRLIPNQVAAYSMFECFENQPFLTEEEHRAAIATDICELLRGKEFAADTEIYVLFHSFPKKSNLPFIHAQLGLVDELVARLPGRVHLAVLGIEQDAELKANMEKVLAEKRGSNLSDQKQYPLLELSLDQLGWTSVAQLKGDSLEHGSDDAKVVSN